MAYRSTPLGLAQSNRANALLLLLSNTAYIEPLRIAAPWTSQPPLIPSLLLASVKQQIAAFIKFSAGASTKKDWTKLGLAEPAGSCEVGKRAWGSCGIGGGHTVSIPNDDVGARRCDCGVHRMEQRIIRRASDGYRSSDAGTNSCPTSYLSTPSSFFFNTSTRAITSEAPTGTWVHPTCFPYSIHASSPYDARPQLPRRPPASHAHRPSPSKQAYQMAAQRTMSAAADEWERGSSIGGFAGGSGSGGQLLY
ncbi:hypothetical protein CVT24_013365 [Panaeolus cyanescens]|uniref:Uncharacterized protein n=1 Tax=Panaeolus cyanescens TaxID=181874 RepID=A0A409YMI4_9AGAR|nr:hypothetical protein CVT24_013365 [Panaeolus cyanescens]